MNDVSVVNDQQETGVLDEKTNEKILVIKDIGTATEVGKLDIKKFIDEAMKLRSFWQS